ncbi:MAG TPA: hypothetical protein VJJ27_00385 [Candidatus Paceibacterota bacterium]
MKSLKTIVYAVCGFALMFLFTTVVLAEEANVSAKATVRTGTTTSVNPVRSAIQGVKDTFKTQKEEVREQAKEKLEAAREQKMEALKKIREEQKDNKRKNVEVNVGKYIENAVRRLTNAVSNLENVASRLDSRIAKLKAAGKDTSRADGLLVEARASIQLAKDGIAKLPNLKAEALKAEKLSDSIALVKEALKDIENNLKMAKGSLSKAIAAVKGLGPIVTPAGDKKGTTTPTASPTTN